MTSIFRTFVEKLGGTQIGSYVGNQGDLFYDPQTPGDLRMSDGSTVGGVPVSGGVAGIVAKGFINVFGAGTTWTGTAGYTVSHDNGSGDEVLTLTFPSAYSSRTDYIIHTTYDGTDWVPGNDASLGVARFADRVEITIRRWDETPLTLGEIMITIINL